LIGYAFIENEELSLLHSVNKCPICVSITNNALFQDEKTKEYLLDIESLNNFMIKHIETIFGRRLINEICDVMLINGRYTKNQS